MDNYEPMLRQTSRTVREYKKRINCESRIFLGIYRGYYPWHAVFNRIFMITEMLSQGVKGWAVYLDADAYIVDLNLDIRKYLADKSKYWAIMARGAFGGAWDVNDGVMIINLEHELTKVVISRWMDVLMSFTDEKMQAAKRWALDGMSGDQAMLHTVLKEDTSLTENLLLEDMKFINSSYATFIRQMLRVAEPDLATRTGLIAKEIDKIFEADSLTRL